MIWFVTVDLLKQVYTMGCGLGFTTQLYTYVYAEDAEKAAAVASAWYCARGAEVKRAQARPAVKADLGSYTMPHAILNLPRAMLEAEYDRRGYSPAWRESSPQVQLPAQAA